jgi:hypothetical protein
MEVMEAGVLSGLPFAPNLPEAGIPLQKHWVKHGDGEAATVPFDCFDYVGGQNRFRLVPHFPAMDGQTPNRWNVGRIKG